MAQHSKKNDLRKQLRAARAYASKQNTRSIHSSLLKQLNKLNIYRTAQKIGLYMSFAHEVPTQILFKENTRRNKLSFVPLITSFQKNTMCFISSNKKVRKNRFGINEPLKQKKINTQSLDIIFMPLLGFDKTGARIGMGGGYYDRHLAFKKIQRKRKKPYLIGLAYEAQHLNSIQNEPWDIDLDGIITEENVYLFNSALR